MTTPALYELASQYRALAEKLADGDFDLTTIHDTIESTGLVEAIELKAQGLMYVARAAVQYVPAIEEEIARLTALKTQREAVAAGVRAYVKKQMENAQIEKISCPFFTITIVKNPPAVDIFDPLSVPAEYMVTPAPKPPVAAPDKQAIALRIKSGFEVAGARLTQATRLKVA